MTEYWTSDRESEYTAVIHFRLGFINEDFGENYTLEEEKGRWYLWNNRKHVGRHLVHTTNDIELMENFTLKLECEYENGTRQRNA